MDGTKLFMVAILVEVSTELNPTAATIAKMMRRVIVVKGDDEAENSHFLISDVKEVSA